jgi:hypothetical protein
MLCLDHYHMYASVYAFSLLGLHRGKVEHLSTKEGSLCVYLFCLSCWDLSSHRTSCRTLGPVGKLSRTRGAPSWFHNVLTYYGEVINIEQKYGWLSVSVHCTYLHTYLLYSLQISTLTLWLMFHPQFMKAVKWVKLSTDTWNWVSIQKTLDLIFPRLDLALKMQVMQICNCGWKSHED